MNMRKVANVMQSNLDGVIAQLNDLGVRYQVLYGNYKKSVYGNQCYDGCCYGVVGHSLTSNNGYGMVAIYLDNITQRQFHKIIKAVRSS